MNFDINMSITNDVDKLISKGKRLKELLKRDLLLEEAIRTGAYSKLKMHFEGMDKDLIIPNHTELNHDESIAMVLTLQEFGVSEIARIRKELDI